MNIDRNRLPKPFGALLALLLAAAPMQGQVTKSFDTDLEGFNPPNFHLAQAEPQPEVAWSSNYGGTMALTVHRNYNWIARLQTDSGPFFDELTLSLANGGVLTFDLIVDAAGLPDGAFRLGVSADGSATGWNEREYNPVSAAAAAGGPVTIPFSIPIRPSTNRVDGDLAFEPGETRFDIVLGHRNGNTVPTTVYIDNFTITAGDVPLEEPPPPPPPPLGGEVLTFDTDTDGFFKADWMPGDVAWSNKHGGEDSGSIAITTTGTWQWAAQLYLTEGALFEELQRSMTAGGTLVFDVTVDSEGLPNGSLGIHLSGNSDASDWNQHDVLTFTQADLTAGEGIATSTVSIPILPTETGGALHFSVNATAFEFNLGRRAGSATGTTTFYVDNFRVVAGDEPLVQPEPLGPFDPIISDFALNDEGFRIGGGADNTFVEWSSEFGGTVKLSKTNDGLIDDKIAKLDIASFRNTLLLPPMQQAGILGGTVEMDVIIPANAIPTDVGGFDVLVTFKNVDVAVEGLGGWAEQRVVLQAYAPGETPSTEERRFRISVPLVPAIDTTSYADPALPFVTAFKLAASHPRYFFEFGSRQDAPGNIAFHFDNLTVIPAAPAGAIVFNNDVETFEATGSATVSHDSTLGGSLRIDLPSGNQTLEAAVGTLPHPFRQGLIRSVHGQGLISLDLIADTGLLSGIQPRLSLKSSAGASREATAPSISAASVAPLGDGREMVRVFVPVSDFNPTTDEIYTGLGIGFTYNKGSPFTVHVDNIVAEVAFGDTTTTVLTFTDGLEGFAATGATAIFREPRPDDATNRALLVVGPSDWTWQTEATYDTASSFGSGLAQAAGGGGEISFDVIFDQFSARNTTAEFDGISITMAIESGGEWRQQEFTFPDLNLPLASGFAIRNVTVPLYPSGSTETDGFVLEPDNTYKVVIGSNSVAGSASSIEFFIDDLTVTSSSASFAPRILAEPKLNLSGGSVYGRLLVAFGDGGTYSATGLPAGMSIDPATGIITGTPTENGTFNITLSVTTEGGTAEAEYEWTVSGAGTAVDLVIVSFSYADNSFTINWDGNNGAPVDVERSTDLSDWTKVATGTTGTSFVDNDAPESKAFYRVVLP